MIKSRFFALSRLARSAPLTASTAILPSWARTDSGPDSAPAVSLGRSIDAQIAVATGGAREQPTAATAGTSTSRHGKSPATVRAASPAAPRPQTPEATGVRTGVRAAAPAAESHLDPTTDPFGDSRGEPRTVPGSDPNPAPTGRPGRRSSGKSSGRRASSANDNPFDTLALSIVRKLDVPPAESRDRLAITRSRPTGRVLLISSARPGEGKSYVASRLASRLALVMGDPVVLLDANSGHPSMHACFKVRPAGYGLFDCLEQGKLLDDRLLASGVRNVLVMPATAGGRQSMLSRVGSCQAILDELRRRFALTVIDGGSLARTGCLTQLVDSTLLVVDASRTRRDIVQGALDSPQIDRGRVLGVVLNRRPEYVPRWLYRRVL